jgi:C-terminal processing protease CtpA/Prc
MSLLAFVAGCSSGGGSGSEADAQEQLEQLTDQVRVLAEKVDRLEKSENDRERRTAQIDQDMTNRINEMVQQAIGRSGRRPPRFVRPAEPIVRVVKRPYMGFDGQNVDPDIAEQLKLTAKTGVIVTNVREGTPAAVAGVKKNDVVQSLGGNAIENFDELKTALGKCKPNETVEMLVQRGEKKLKLTIKLGERTERIGG